MLQISNSLVPWSPSDGLLLRPLLVFLWESLSCRPHSGLGLRAMCFVASNTDPVWKREIEIARGTQQASSLAVVAEVDASSEGEKLNVSRAAG